MTAATTGCSSAPQPGPRQVVEQSCRRLTGLAEPYSVTSETAPFGLLRPTSPARQWHEDGEAMAEAAEPLARLGGTRHRELARLWMEVGRYLITASRDPEGYDAEEVEERLYAADGLCAAAVEEAV